MTQFVTMRYSKYSAQGAKVDYFGILKRGWHITWRYKALWVLGFFAAAASGGSSGGGTPPTSTGSTSSWQTDAPVQIGDTGGWFADNLWLIIAISVLIFLLAVVFIVLSIAARGGLIHEVNQAEERGSVSLSRGWGKGFHYFWRVFGIGFLLALPFVAVVFFFVLIMVGAGFTLGLGAGDGAAIGGFIFSMICGIGLLFLLIIPMVVIIGILNEIATRYGVLMDTKAIGAIKQAWTDLWGKRGTFVMWLVMILPGMAYGIVLAVVSMIFILPAMFMFFGGAWVGGIALILLLALALIVPNAAFNTFVSASWTVFFRRMTGMEIVETPAAPPAPVGAEGGFMPPPPPPTPSQ